MKKKKIELPVVAMRGMTIIPGAVIHFDISREKSRAAIDKAMLETQEIFLVSQKESNTMNPAMQDLHHTGTVAEIKQVLKLPNHVLRVLVSAKCRARLLSLEEEGYLYGEIQIVETSSDDLQPSAKKAMMQVLQGLIRKYYILNPGTAQEGFENLENVEDLYEFLEKAAMLVNLNTQDKQAFLEAEDVNAMYEVLVNSIGQENAVAQYRNEFRTKIKDKIDQNQREYILREQIKLIREELGEEDTEGETEEFLKETEKLKAKKEVKDKIKKEIKRYRNTSPSSAEGNVIRTYIETMLELPWDKMSKENQSIEHAGKILERDHYGLEQVKERMIEFLAVRAFKKNKAKGNSPIVCLVGPPGTGKTSIARSVAEALNRKYVRICLGGVRDEAEIRGHRKTYVGAMPGRVAKALKEAGVKNPLLLLDEVDKLGNDYKGDPSSALLEILDTEQNMHFRDHYLEIPLDLSEVLFIATANDAGQIPRPLRDRMEMIEISGYTANEKQHIALEHLLEKQRKKHGLSERQFSIGKKAMAKLIQNYTREAGVRNLEREIAHLCRKAVKELLETNKKSIKITESNLSKYLGTEKYSTDMANENDDIGIVRGLAWTSVGGDTLEIEVNTMPGKGKLQLTGKLGDVMKESAQAAFTYVRSIAADYQVKNDYFEKHDIHVHVPEGAVPKDGPSAGITIATAILSAVAKRPVKASLAMTGEVTLRGRVLPIGGLKEKLLAAKTAGIKQVLVPEKNKKDLEEISEEIKKGLKIELVSSMDEVLKKALCE